jgi:glycosyltransferase involved in cell wall biosynthesis
LRDGQDVLLIAPNDSEALGMAMQRITNDHELALRLARNGRWLSDTFGWDRIAQQHVDIYTAIR